MSKIPVFDIGDTLFPPVKFFRESVMEEADTEGFRIGNFNIFEPESSEKYFADKGVEIDGEKVRENYIERVKSYMRNERVEFLKRCSEEFGAIGVISDKWEFAGSFYEEIFRNHGVDFEGIIISEVVGAKKPDNQIFNAFLERRERKAESFVYYGNHGRRDAAAQKVGMDFVFTTEYDNLGTTHKGRKISELNFENVKTAVQRQ